MTSTIHHYHRGNHQRHFSQPNPRSTAKDNDAVTKQEKFDKQDAADRARQLEEFEEAMARDQAEHVSMLQRMGKTTQHDN